ncbi:hypothetical protein H0H93_001447 [Arthromyces matolae]|nr:hypothetical protein H0H93_001447 [Arthromyces matolae]
MQGVASPPWVQGIFQELEAIKSLAYETKAMVRNVSRALHNKQEKLSNYVPLCKWLPGSGREIALGIFTAAEVNDAENLLTDAGHQNPVVGDIPRTPSSPSDVTRVELAALVIFYNHNMGLVVGENQLARKEKLHTFMTDSSTFK